MYIIWQDFCRCYIKQKKVILRKKIVKKKKILKSMTISYIKKPGHKWTTLIAAKKKIINDKVIDMDNRLKVVFIFSKLLIP